MQQFIVDHVCFIIPDTHPSVLKTTDEILKALWWDMLLSPLYLPNVNPSDYSFFAPCRSVFLQSDLILILKIKIGLMIGFFFKTARLLPFQNSFATWWMQEWCSFLTECTLNKSFFHFNKKRVSSIFSKKKRQRYIYAYNKIKIFFDFT